MIDKCREDKGQSGAEEDIEITWEPGNDVMMTFMQYLIMKMLFDFIGLNETTKSLLKKKTVRTSFSLILIPISTTPRMQYDIRFKCQIVSWGQS